MTETIVDGKVQRIQAMLYAKANLQTVCLPCHHRLTAIQQVD